MVIVTPWGTRRSVDFLKARRLRRAAFVTLLGVCQCLMVFPASAERLPAIDRPFPADLGVGGKFSALRYSMTGSTDVFTFDPTNITNPFKSDGDI